MISVKRHKDQNSKGYSLIEVLIVILVFSIIAIIATQSTILSLGGARRTDSSTKVRENLSFALSIVERQLRNAREITSTCDGSPMTTINYIDQHRAPASFSCIQSPGGSGQFYVASGSATVRLTSDDIFLTNCRYVCTDNGPDLPPDVTISFTGQDRSQVGPDAAQTTLSTTIRLRVY